MSFLRWIKYKMVRIGTLVLALLSWLGAVYSLLSFESHSKFYLAITGAVAGVVFLLIGHYYKIKAQNLFFIEDKKKKAQVAAEA